MAHVRIDHIAHHLDTMTHHRSNEGKYGRVFRLIPGVQSYDWGIKGAARPRVAQFAAATKELDFEPQNDKPYAELWMGTHPSMPSRIIPPADDTHHDPSQREREYEALSSYLSAHPQLIGDKVAAKFSDEKPGCLPFLFKVLSVGKALSIQAHPDKQLGKKLHQQRPDVYKDANHKPEMAIALTPFRGFCGFRPLREILHYIKAVPEFAQLVQLSDAELDRAGRISDEKQVKPMLKTIFGNLMNSSSSSYEPLAAQLAQRFGKGQVEGVAEVERRLVLKLADEFPRDIGIFCTFLLNISSLNPDEALFLQANEPHAYLEGEILECMASSDNVVRAGLTPKLRDTETLISMCTYQSGSERGRLEPTAWTKSTPESVEALLYDPPIAEFSVVLTRLAAHDKVRNLPLDGPSIVLVLQGQVELHGLRLEAGQLAFVAADTEVQIHNVAGTSEARLARAFVEA